MDLSGKNDVLLKLQRYCAYQDRCTWEIEKKLADLEAPEEWWEELVDRLRAEAFLDDLRFTESFVSGKMNQKKWGRIKIIQALKTKHIPSELIHEVFEGLDDEIESKNLSILAEKKYNALAEPDPFKKKAKVFRFLQQKGYSSEQITRCLNNLTR